jgi:hypothetical protein
MSPKWFSKRTPRVDPEELARTAEESLRETRGQQAHVNALTSYLNDRQGQNGFGEDFGITLIPRRA